ncbi:beta-lactamase family protein [bacterium]|nr:beta-lactamase family protein [bacterium]
MSKTGNYRAVSVMNTNMTMISGVRIWCIVCLVLATIISAITCSGKKSSADSDGFEQCSASIRDIIESTHTPSLSVAVAKDGIILWEESFGWADREKHIRATPQTVYSLASVSKPITATAMLLLAERGAIDLDEPIQSYLGESGLTVYEGDAEDATVMRLLHHTAGLPTIWNFYFDGGERKRPPISESIKRYGIITSPPGTAYEYSNLGYGIAEHIIEQVSGRHFAEFMRKEIFEPLNLENTFVIVDTSQYNSIACRYLENKSVSPFYDVMSRGGGGICSSVHDLVRFGMFHLKNHLSNQKAIIADTTIEYMQSFADPEVPDSPYKFGWDIKDIHGHRVVSHGGGMPGVSSALMLVPAANMCIAVLSNGTYIDLFKIGAMIIDEVLPEGNEATVSHDVNESHERVQFPSDYLYGQWQGFILMENDSLPVQLSIDQAREVTVRVGDEQTESLLVQPFTFNNGRLSGSVDFTVPARDALSARHQVYFSLRKTETGWSGYAAAVSYRAEVFFLPYYIVLRKI